jgi:hypothetical protein
LLGSIGNASSVLDKARDYAMARYVAVVIVLILMTKTMQIEEH